MNNLFLILIIAIPSIPVIAIIDYVTFRQFMVCPKCGDKLKISWWYFMIPTFFELLLFMAGIAVGLTYYLG